MKSIFIVFCLLTLLSTACTAQKPQANTYHQKPALFKFEGTWRYVNGVDTVILKLKKLKKSNGLLYESYHDVLVGTHAYIKGAIVIESDMHRYDSIATMLSKRMSFLGSNYSYVDSNLVTGRFSDLSLRKGATLELKYLPTFGAAQMEWKLRNSEGLRGYRPGIDQPFNPAFTLPVSIILTKIE